MVYKRNELKNAHHATLMFRFEVEKSDSCSQARIGKFQTPHGIIKTPVFMPCGTKGTVKTLTPDEVKELGANIMLVNAYHMMLRPGEDSIEKQKGLHEWIGWNKPLITDSGGYQIFSLAKLRHVTDDEVTFQSHIDGRRHTLTPEKATLLQEKLGADIIMAFDQCIPAHSEKKEAVVAMHRTHQWLERGLKVKKRKNQAFFPIIQGGLFDDLRMESAEFCAKFNTPGIAIGGLSVGETKSEMYHILDVVCPYLPLNKPRYLMGVGNPEDIFEAVEKGIDMFDCVQPTRLARHGKIWTKEGSFSLKNSRFREDPNPIEKNCACYTCKRFKRSYLRHLLTENESAVLRLLTIHNLHFLLELMRNIRKSIKEGKLQRLKEEFLQKFLPHHAKS